MLLTSTNSLFMHSNHRKRFNSNSNTNSNPNNRKRATCCDASNSLVAHCWRMKAEPEAEPEADPSSNKRAHRYARIIDTTRQQMIAANAFDKQSKRIKTSHNRNQIATNVNMMIILNRLVLALAVFLSRLDTNSCDRLQEQQAQQQLSPSRSGQVNSWLGKCLITVI